MTYVFGYNTVLCYQADNLYTIQMNSALEFKFCAYFKVPNSVSVYHQTIPSYHAWNEQFCICSNIQGPGKHNILQIERAQTMYTIHVSL